MKFEEILPFLRLGKKVRCRNWNPDFHIYFEKDTPFDHADKILINWGFDREDIFSDEWELYQENKEPSKF